MSKNRWILCNDVNPEARIRLLCFPFAGGGTLPYRKWGSGLPSSVEVCSVLLPGRGSRLSEPPIHDLPTMTEQITVNVVPLLDKPIVFFGHSMGAMLAFETARALRRRGCPLPQLMFLSGCGAIHRPSTYGPMSHLSDDDLIAELNSRFQQIPPKMVQHKALRKMILPMLRGDMTAVDNYVYQDEPPFNMPIVTFGGVEDGISAESLIEWAQHTTGSAEHHMLPGGHFFINSARTQLLETMSCYLKR